MVRGLSNVATGPSACPKTSCELHTGLSFTVQIPTAPAKMLVMTHTKWHVQVLHPSLMPQYYPNLHGCVAIQ